eukprot:172772-Rhodomonas_salina.3
MSRRPTSSSQEYAQASTPTHTMQHGYTMQSPYMCNGVGPGMLSQPMLHNGYNGLQSENPADMYKANMPMSNAMSVPQYSPLAYQANTLAVNPLIGTVHENALYNGMVQRPLPGLQDVFHLPALQTDYRAVEDQQNQFMHEPYHQHMQSLQHQHMQNEQQQQQMQQQQQYHMQQQMQQQYHMQQQMQQPMQQQMQPYPYYNSNMNAPMQFPVQPTQMQAEVNYARMMADMYPDHSTNHNAKVESTETKSKASLKTEIKKCMEKRSRKGQNQ